MAESPFKITRSDDGLSVRCEFDAHYVSDEDAQRIMSYVNELQDENARLRSCLSDDAENAKMIMGENANLRELVRDMWRDGMCECDERGACAECEYGYLDRMCELGIEVDA